MIWVCSNNNRLVRKVRSWKEHTISTKEMRYVFGKLYSALFKLYEKFDGLKAIHYRPPAKLREDNVCTPVCHSVHRGWGVCCPLVGGGLLPLEGCGP